MPFKNTSDKDIEYLVKEESFMVRRTLNVEVKEDDLKQQRDNIFHTRCHINNNKGIIFSILDATSIISYVV